MVEYIGYLSLKKMLACFWRMKNLKNRKAVRRVRLAPHFH